MILDLQATDRWQAIGELIGHLVTTGQIPAPHRDPITAVVKKRETSMSTGIGFGLGIPHASTDLIQEPIRAAGRSAKGINFDALDSQPVRLVILFLVPQGQFQKHLDKLGKLARSLHDEAFRRALLEVSDDAALDHLLNFGEDGTSGLPA